MATAPALRLPRKASSLELHPTLSRVTLFINEPFEKCSANFLKTILIMSERTFSLEGGCAKNKLKNENVQPTLIVTYRGSGFCIDVIVATKIDLQNQKCVHK